MHVPMRTIGLLPQLPIGIALAHMKTSLEERDRQVMWHPYTQAKISPLPFAIARGDGSYLYTEDGHKILDGISSWWTSAHGHCHPHIVEAITKQLSKLDHVIFANCTHEPAVKLAELLLLAAPKGLARVFYSDNGSTAVEVAIKMAFQYWQHKHQSRPYFIALEHSYHGDTFGAMSVSERGSFTKPFWPLLFGVITQKSPCVSEVQDDTSEEMLTAACLDGLKKTLKQHQGQIAGIIIEPMLQAAGGMRIFTKGFLQGIRALCDQENILLIADEVATGFYRTGTMFACEHEQVSPDIMCIAKGLTGGFLPLAATLATSTIYEAFLSDNKADALLHGHSFTGNPIACAAAVASMELFAQPQTKDGIAAIVHAMTQGIEPFKHLKQVAHARSLGCVAIIELADDDAGYLSNRAHQIVDYCYSHGLYIRPLGNIIYLMPPLCTTPEEIAWALKLIKSAIVAG